MKFSDRFVYEVVLFMQKCAEELGDIGEEKAEAMLDAFDPGLKRQILLMTIQGTISGPMQIRAVSTYDTRQKIAAIKEIRAMTGFGLKEAKDVIDEADQKGISRIAGAWSLEQRMQMRERLAGTGYTLV